MRAIFRMSLKSARKHGDFDATVAETVGRIHAPWAQRGLRQFIAIFGPAAANEEGAEDDIAAFSIGYSEGATDALKLAKAILSDPVVRGQEELALDMLADGFGHADIRAKITAIKSGRVSP